MSYLKNKLVNSSESVQYEALVSRWTLAPSGIYFVAAIVVSLFINKFVWPASILLFLLGFILLAQSLIYLATTELLVTDNRVLFKKGLLSVNTEELPPQKIETIEVKQSLIARIFNYGTLIIKGVGIGSILIRGVHNPYSATRVIYGIRNTQKHS